MNKAYMSLLVFYFKVGVSLEELSLFYWREWINTRKAIDSITSILTEI
jgi:hypothetical protein